MGLRERDKAGGAGRIVERTVADVVAGGVRVAAAEMIPVGGVDHVFVGPRGPGEDADHVLRGLALDHVGEID